MRNMPAQQFSITREVEYGSPQQNETVQRIIKRVREEGDAALRAYAKEFDGVEGKFEQYFSEAPGEGN